MDEIKEGRVLRSIHTYNSLSHIVPCLSLLQVKIIGKSYIGGMERGAIAAASSIFNTCI